ncbi:uncharacterized protein B0I36DRAFT_351321 [Microdochium trichocladiopsis]|uniref:Uncharacterized protein n=1 Tax=Microdochium trichocladiopsis TaxID=1682393 RepID=A0A9P8Y5A7_9PEZI|nr:uncharacterized protein B0I36DRAFT_351321 [Microdochium trichocladiopsis]KAH7027846.1 hypothetical protein B0I36DRAFT_351321 [Microdochium trichocladiopsis]
MPSLACHWAVTSLAVATAKRPSPCPGCTRRGFPLDALYQLSQPSHLTCHILQPRRDCRKSGADCYQFCDYLSTREIKNGFDCIVGAVACTECSCRSIFTNSYGALINFNWPTSAYEDLVHGCEKPYQCKQGGQPLVREEPSGLTQSWHDHPSREAASNVWCSPLVLDRSRRMSQSKRDAATEGTQSRRQYVLSIVTPQAGHFNPCFVRAPGSLGRTPAGQPVAFRWFCEIGVCLADEPSSPVPSVGEAALGTCDRPRATVQARVPQPSVWHLIRQWCSQRPLDFSKNADADVSAERHFALVLVHAALSRQLHQQFPCKGSAVPRTITRCWIWNAGDACQPWFGVERFEKPAWKSKAGSRRPSPLAHPACEVPASLPLAIGRSRIPWLTVVSDCCSQCHVTTSKHKLSFWMWTISRCRGAKTVCVRGAVRVHCMCPAGLVTALATSGHAATASRTGDILEARAALHFRACGVVGRPMNLCGCLPCAVTVPDLAWPGQQPGPSADSCLYNHEMMACL